LTELVLTAYDVQRYLREALPALRAAIYRGDVSQAKDVLALYDDALYDEDALSQALIGQDYSWVFTEDAVDAEVRDPRGTLVDLIYPLILVYQQPDLFQVEVTELDGVIPIWHFLATGELDVPGVAPVQPGFREGLRAMWEIVGFLTPEATQALWQYCATAGLDRARNRSEETARLVEDMAEGLQAVVEHGLGLIIERD
jgi:hypothetical protein